MREPKEALTHTHELLTKQAEKSAELTIETVRKTTNFVNSFIDILVGVCFIAMGVQLINFYNQWDYSFRDWVLTEWITIIDVLVGGTILIVNPRRTFNSSIGIYAITMGIISFCGMWENLGSESPSFGMFDQIIDDVYFIVYLVILVLSVNLMISGLSYIRGKPRGTMGMTLKAALMLALNLFSFLVLIKTENLSILEAIKKDSITAIQIAMFFIFLMMMDTEEARAYNTKNRLRNSTDAIRHSRTFDRKSYVELSDAVALADAEFKDWKVLDDGGPAEREYCFPIQTAGGASYITVQRWKGDDVYYVTISDHQVGSNIRATRFKVTSFEINDERTLLSIRGANHFTIKLTIKMPLSEFEPRWSVKA